MHYIPWYTNVENVLTIIPEINKNDTVTFRVTIKIYQVQKK